MTIVPSATYARGLRGAPPPASSFPIPFYALAGGCGLNSGFRLEYFRSMSRGIAEVGTVMAANFGWTLAVVEVTSLL